MKTKNGKCGVPAALTAVLLVTAALITSCSAQVDGTDAQGGYQPPAGMGYVSVNVPQFSGERTVLPSEGTWTSFDLSIQQYTALTGGSTTGAVVSKPLFANLSDPINLAPGFYALTVTARTSVGPAAEGTSARFTISPGQGTSVSVTIKPLPYTSTDAGTFEYTIDLNSLTADVEMTITPLVSGAAHNGGTPFTVTEGAGTPITLTPGSYIVFLEATVDTQTASTIHTVNIHQNLTSSVTFVFDGTNFLAEINGINIDYTSDEVKPVLAKSGPPTAVTESTTISLSLSGLASETITISNAPAFTTMTWYCGSATPTTVIGGTFTITAGTSPFSAVVTYPVTVVGHTPNGAYSTSFKVSIVN